MTPVATWTTIWGFVVIATTAAASFLGPADAFLPVPSVAVSRITFGTFGALDNRDGNFIATSRQLSDCHSRRHVSTSSRLWGGRSPSNPGRDGNGGGSEGSQPDHGFVARNKDRTDIRSFLTQRTIQTFVFLLNSCREEANIRWMENLLDFTSIDKFHGTGAFNATIFPTWDSIFLDMIGRQEETIVISITSEEPQRRRRRGLSGHNSYLESLSKPPKERAQGYEDQELGARNPYLEEKTIDYTFDIDPASLLRRMLSVREQIAKEWVKDLDMLSHLNDEIMESYEEYLEQQEQLMETEDENGDEEDHEDLSIVMKDKDDEESVEKKLSSKEDDQMNAGVFAASSKSDVKKPIFDRNAGYTFSESLCNLDRESSHFRKKSFDLLLLLATQESIHRVLKLYQAKDAEKGRNSNKVFSTGKTTSYDWLLDFYRERVTHHFDGYQTTGRAEDFLEELLRSPPTVIESSTEVVAFIDPARVAEDIIRERSEVALDWMEIAKTIQGEHTDLRRLLFTNMVSKSAPTEETLGAPPTPTTSLPSQSAIDAVTADIAKNILNVTSVGIFE